MLGAWRVLLVLALDSFMLRFVGLGDASVYGLLLLLCRVPPSPYKKRLKRNLPTSE